MRRVYLDNAATSPVRPEVIEAIASSYRETIGNPSSLHRFGQLAKRSLEGARRTVAGCLGADPKEIYFVPGGTVGDNMALLGAAQANRDRGRHIITSEIEHHAVLHACDHLESQDFDVTRLGVDRQGLVDPSEFEGSVREDTMLVSIILANNETGTVQPLAEISAIAKDRGVLVHTDAVQAIGKMPVSVDSLGVDLLSLTAHKFYGPKGIGVLYARAGTSVSPLIYGGSQERELAPGTENIAGAVGLAKALELATGEIGQEPARIGGLRDRLEDGILARIPDVQVNGHPTLRLPNILNVSFAFVEGESLLLALDTRGIAVSTGSACTAGSTDPSHVLLAMGLDRDMASGSLRFSFGRENDEEDVGYVLDNLVDVVQRLRELSPKYAGRDNPRGTC